MASYTDSVIGMRVWQAAKVVQSGNVWVGIGRTTAWNDTDTPPTPNPNATQIDGLVVLKKAEILSLVIPDPNGTIEHLGQKWSTVPLEDARSRTARWVYVATWLRYDEVPIVTFRQTGVFADVVLGDGVPPGKLVLLPEEVADLGFLLVLNNRSPINRAADQKELLEFVVEF
ncbi:MAG TPA: hypothetical protein GX517_11710 [Alicyclobacillus sp.]|nr:hypothetical protein [Alicyclobacillus sp.]